MDDLIKRMIEPDLISSDVDKQSLTLSRWRFFIQCQVFQMNCDRLIALAQCILSTNHLMTLEVLAHQFLVKDIDDPELNATLLQLLQGRFDLCAEFKKLYVYGCTAKRKNLDSAENRDLSTLFDLTTKRKSLDLVEYEAELDGGT